MNFMTRFVSATLIILLCSTTSIIIADSEIVNIVKQGDVEFQAQYLPERSYGTVGFAPLSLKIKNDGNETIVFDHGSIDLQTQSVKEVMKSLKIKSVGSEALKGAGIGTLPGIGVGAATLIPLTTLFYKVANFMLIMGVAGLCSLGVVIIGASLGASIGAIKQTIKRKLIKRKIRKLAFEQKKIEPGSTEEVVLFVENNDKVHDFTVQLVGSSRSVAIRA